MATKKSTKSSDTVFPKTVYVYEEYDGDESFFLVFASPQEIAVVGEKRLVGVYEFAQEVVVEGVVQLTDKTAF